MMSSLKNSFEKIRQGEFQEVFIALESAFRKFGIDYYIIGAFARDIWLAGNKYLPGLRATLDLGFAIYIAAWDRYYTLKEYLQNNFGFIANKEPYRLHSPKGLILDLIPFGGVEKDRQVYLKGNPPVELSVFGTMEVTGKAIALCSGFKVITLPGLCIMKLISWSQRPEWRTKDLEDFWFLLENYNNIVPDLIFTEPFLDLLEVEELSIKSSFARILGRQMKPILLENRKLSVHVQSVIKNLRSDFSQKEVEELYLANPNDQRIQRWYLIQVLEDEIRN